MSWPLNKNVLTEKVYVKKSLMIYKDFSIFLIASFSVLAVIFLRNVTVFPVFTFRISFEESVFKATVYRRFEAPSKDNPAPSLSFSPNRLE